MVCAVSSLVYLVFRLARSGSSRTSCTPCGRPWRSSSTQTPSKSCRHSRTTGKNSFFYPKVFSSGKKNNTEESPQIVYSLLDPNNMYIYFFRLKISIKPHILLKGKTFFTHKKCVNFIDGPVQNVTCLHTLTISFTLFTYSIQYQT